MVLYSLGRIKAYIVPWVSVRLAGKKLDVSPLDETPVTLRCEGHTRYNPQDGVASAKCTPKSTFSGGTNGRRLAWLRSLVGG